MKWDGHTHTPYCPHGSSDPLEAYVEQAIRNGFERYSFTEHAPLPHPFIDPVPEQDSAMRMEDLEAYLEECHRLKRTYSSQIEIKVGLEVDYLYGYEKETKKFLDRVGSRLDDSILSLHFIPVHEKWFCLDYSPDEFQSLLSYFQSVDHLYEYYYDILLHAVQSDLGIYKPQRMGHLSLIEKFKIKFPYHDKNVWWEKMQQILYEVKKRGFQLDFNTAGIQKPLCKDVYPSPAIFKEAQQMGIPFVYGSDAHQAIHVGHHYHLFTGRYA